MPTRITRERLHSLAWEKPMIHLAAELGLSDVGLRKACHRHDIPTPPAGWWAKKAHGKPVTVQPLPRTRPAGQLVSIYANPSEAGQLSGAREAVRTRLAQAARSVGAPNPVVERTIARLARARAGTDNLKRVAGPGLVTVAVRPSSEERTGQLLQVLAEAASRAGVELCKDAGGASFQCDGETVGVELYEAPDQVEHVPAEKELAAVAKWKREREERHRKFGYWSDYGEPRIPRWEEQYNGRLAIRLEQVRARGREDWWGKVVTRTFADTRTRDVFKMVPRMVEAVVAIAAAKKSNRALDERRRVEAEEQARRWAEAEQLKEREKQRGKALDQLVTERAELDRLARLVEVLRRRTGEELPPRVARLVKWASAKLARGEEQLSAGALEQRLEGSGLFGEED